MTKYADTFMSDAIKNNDDIGMAILEEPVAEETKEYDVDGILTLIGEFGRSQIVLTIILCFLMIPTACQVLIMTFLGVNPPWTCNNGSIECNRAGVFSVNHEFYYRRCVMKRESWRFVKEKEFSIVTEWDLVCGKASLSYVAFSAMQVGDAIGAIILGIVSDKYGRKDVMFGSWFAFVATALLSSLANNFWVFLLLQFVTGFFQGGTFVILWVFMSELLGPHCRSYSNILWCAFTFALSSMSLQAWLIPKWRILEIVMTAPYLILLVTYKFIPESVRWLRANNRRDSAEQILRDVAKFNNTKWPKIRLSRVNVSNEIKNSKASFKHVFYPWKVFFCTSSQIVIWFSIGLAYYGLSLSSENLSGNLYRDFALVSIADIPSNLVVIWFCDRCGRKRTSMFSTAVAGLVILLIPFIPSSASFSWMRVAMGVGGKFLANISYNAVYMWSTEIFPTTVRTQGLGVCSTATVMGTALSPWVGQYLIHVHQMLPFLIMGSLLILSGVLCCLLPETNKQNMSETPEDQPLIGLHETEKQWRNIGD